METVRSLWVSTGKVLDSIRSTVYGNQQNNINSYGHKVQNTPRLFGMVLMLMFTHNSHVVETIRICIISMSQGWLTFFLEGNQRLYQPPLITVHSRDETWVFQASNSRRILNQLPEKSSVGNKTPKDSIYLNTWHVFTFLGRYVCT